jgi:hypothetical protein
MGLPFQCVKELKIPSSNDPMFDLGQRLSQFREMHSRAGNLLVIFYAGHGNVFHSTIEGVENRNMVSGTRTAQFPAVIKTPNLTQKPVIMLRSQSVSIRARCSVDF